MKASTLIVPGAILGLGFLGTWGLISAKGDGGMVEPALSKPSIRAARVETSTVTLDVDTQGFVTPPTETHLTAEVAGAISWISETLETGRFFRRGEPLLRLESSDYFLAVKQAEAELASVEIRLAEEKAEAVIAREELRNQQMESLSAEPLASRRLKVAEAEAALEAAQAKLANARTKLEKCTIVAPYDGRTQDRKAGLGQFVGPGTVLASIHPTAFAEIELSVTRAQLAMLGISAKAGLLAAEDRAPVRFTADGESNPQGWDGSIFATEGEIDDRTQMSNLIARVVDPYGLERDRSEILPMGLFVRAIIRGPLESVFLVPRTALQDRNRVMVVDDQGLLRNRRVQVVKIVDDIAIVTEGLVAGELVSASRLPNAIDGTAVLVEELPNDLHTRFREVDWSSWDGEPGSGDGDSSSGADLESAPAASDPPWDAATASRSMEESGAEPSAELVDIRVSDPSNIVASLRGTYEISSHRLATPDRFVVDLRGVRKSVDRGSVELARSDVLGIRFGQWKGAPDWVTRVVFDLADPSTVPEIVPTSGGLVFRLPQSEPAPESGQGAGGDL